MRPLLRNSAWVTALAAVAAVAVTGCEERFTALKPDSGAVMAPVAVQPVPAPAPAETAPTFEDPPGTAYFAPSADGKLHVWFMDVGHGDAILIRSPVGRTVLIDGGPAEASSHLMRRLPELLDGPLDMVVITHPHPDHFGALARALQVVGVKRVLAPRPSANHDEGYRELVHFLESRRIPFFAPAAPPNAPGQPLEVALGDGARLSIYWPRTPAEAELDVENKVDANSMVMRLSWRETSVLLAGDATRETEAHLLAKRWPFRSTLLKVGAHGDDIATSEAFAKAVKPEAAIISVGAGNRRGSPSRQTLDRLAAVGADVYRTDLDGEIRADSDGETFVLVTERPAAGEEPHTPHLYGKKDDSQEGFARAVAADVVRTRPKVVRVTPKGAEESYGKVIEVGPDDRDQRRKTGRSTKARSTKSDTDGRYVASKNSDVFHVPNCRNAKRIHKKNLLVFNSRADAARERRPAGDCNP